MGKNSMNHFWIYPGDEIGSVYMGDDGKKYPIKRIKMPWDDQNPRHNYVINNGEADAPFVSVHQHGGKHKLAWIYVPENMRWKGLGKTLLGIAFELAERTRKIIDSTSTMRKPSITSLIEKYGFKPEGDGVQVKIIGEEVFEGRRVPVVYRTGWKGQLDEVHDGRRFLIVSTDSRDEKREGRIITLATPYRLGNDDESQQLFYQSRMEDRSNFLISDLSPNFKL